MTWRRAGRSVIDHGHRPGAPPDCTTYITNRPSQQRRHDAPEEAAARRAMDERIQQVEPEIPRLRRYARYLTRDADQADDLVQEALTRAIAKIDTWQPGTNLRAWLFVILRNAHISEIRRQSRAPIDEAVADDHPGLAVTGGHESHLALVELHKAFEGLSEEHREVVHLVAVEGLKYDEAAAILEIPVGTVRSRLSRARTALRLRLEGKVEEEQEEQKVP